MGAIDKADAYQSVLSTEQLGVDLVQLVPSQIVVAIARSTGKIALRHPVGLKGSQHPLGVMLSHGINMGELLLDFHLRLGGQSAHTVRYL